MRASLKKTIVLFALGIVPAIGISASNNFVVKNIKLEGLSRVSSKTIYSDLPIKSGQEVSMTDTSEIITDLYRTGFFNDIKIYRDQDNLIIKLKERPAISTINISGNDAIKTKDLQKGLTMAGLEVGNIYNPSLLQEIKQSLDNEYYNLGKYAVNIDFKIVPLTRNRIAVKIIISEGKTAKIRRINIIGNNKYPEGDLVDQLVLTTPSLWNLWGLFTSDTQYSSQRMQASLEKLSSYYLNRGYLDFRVLSSQVSLNPDKNNTYLAINVAEGEVYKVSSVSIEGKLILPRSETRKMIDIKPGEVFSRKKILDSAKAIKSKLGEMGYAFAQVNPVPLTNKEKRTVALTFYVEPGKKVYINQINFMGNTATNDVVYRREIPFYEEGIYDSSLIDKSKIRLQRLPYVQKVDVKKVPVAGSDDLINLDYDVKERSANSISANIGYSGLYGPMVGGGFSMPNLLGTGNQFSINTQLSRPYKTISTSYTDPYFTQSGISQTVGAYLTNVDNSSTDLVNYSTDSMGLTLNYSIPVSFYSSVNVGGGYDFTRLKQPNGDQNSETVTNFMNKYGSVFNTFTGNLGWTYNTTNRAFFPTSGQVFDINSTVAVPGSTLTWYKLNASNKWFHSITDYATVSLKLGAGYGNGYGDTDQLPFIDNYYGGGWGSVRGYTQGTMGPIDQLCDAGTGTAHPTCTGKENGNSIGGNLNLYANLDLLFPVPGVASDNMRWGVFADAGNVYDTYKLNTIVNSGSNPTSPSFSNLRYSVGIEFQWLSPLGPLAFSLAKPINAKQGEDTNIFQFTLGQTF